MMDRRAFITLVGGSILAPPLVTEAQQAGKIPRIGVLAFGVPATYVSRYEAFRQGLREFGYMEGQSIAIEYRYAEGKYERLYDLAAELVRLKVDVIVVSSTPETDAAKRVTTSTPIVFAIHNDPVGRGHVASLARPGGNITGLASGVGAGFTAKRLQLLKEAFPRISRVAVLWNAANSTVALQWPELREAAPALGVALQSYEVRGNDDFASAFSAMTRQRPDALMTLDDPLLLNSRTSIAAFAARERLPAISSIREYGEAGLLMVYGLNVADNYRRAAVYVDKILKGAKPGDLPVEQPTKFELTINLKTAKAMRLTIPQTLLQQATRVIE